MPRSQWHALCEPLNYSPCFARRNRKFPSFLDCSRQRGRLVLLNRLSHRLAASVAHRSERVRHNCQRFWTGAVMSQHAFEASTPTQGLLANHQGTTSLAKLHQMPLDGGQEIYQYFVFRRATDCVPALVDRTAYRTWDIPIRPRHGRRLDLVVQSRAVHHRTPDRSWGRDAWTKKRSPKMQRTRPGRQSLSQNLPRATSRVQLAITFHAAKAICLGRLKSRLLRQT